MRGHDNGRRTEMAHVPSRLGHQGPLCSSSSAGWVLLTARPVGVEEPRMPSLGLWMTVWSWPTAQSNVSRVGLRSAWLLCYSRQSASQRKMGLLVLYSHYCSRPLAGLLPPASSPSPSPDPRIVLWTTLMLTPYFEAVRNSTSFTTGPLFPRGWSSSLPHPQPRLWCTDWHA